jgi:hypothetical protein
MSTYRCHQFLPDTVSYIVWLRQNVRAGQSQRTYFASEVGRIRVSGGVTGTILGSYPERALKLMRGSGDALGWAMSSNIIEVSWMTLSFGRYYRYY